jgi:murein DD-endopeptidase MepM/ murein hydrolase activator NlpD
VSAVPRAVAVAAVVVSLLAAAPAAAAAPPCLLPPVARATVIDPFRPPACPYCAGNRGIDLATPAGGPVVAAAAGRVTFAGSVAGTRYVVVEHTGGYRTTYGQLASAAVRAGQQVVAGAPVGTSTGRLFFGLRLADEYLDPAPHLAVVRSLPQLVPLNGRNRRPARIGQVICPDGGGTGGVLR